MKSMVGVLFAAATVLAFPALAQGKPDFSGNWKINATQSDFGPLPPAPSYTRNVRHSDPRLTIAEEHGIGEETFTRSYTIGGKPVAFQSNGADVVGKALWENEALVFTFVGQVAGFEFLYRSTWRLSADGATLTNTLDGHTPQGGFRAVFVFERQ